MSNLGKLVQSVRARLNIGGGEGDVATISRALIGRNGVVIDGDKLQQGDATQIAALQALLLGSNDSLGQISSVSAGTSVSIAANEQAITYGAFTVYGTLTIYGEFRNGAYPF